MAVTLETIAKELKALRKDVRKIRQHFEDPTGEKAAARAQNNGFNKPQKVTETLRAFIGLAEGEMISRAQVANFMNKYFEQHGLKNGQKINMDEKLKALLEVPEGVQLTFLNVQHYMNKHYIKEPKPPRATKKTDAPTDTPAGASSDAPSKEKKSRPKVAKA